MADSTENNKINSYGVWVKRGPGESEEESPQANLNEADLPDLSEDFHNAGDMFITPPTEPQAETPIASEEKDASDDIPNIDIEGFDGADFSAFDVPKDIATPTDSISDIPDGEVSFDDLLGGGGSDGEISLDAFMSGDSDEISLDDFLDDFGGGSSQKEDDVPDDTPLDINVKFNEDPENQVPTEDIPLEDNSDDAMEEEIAEQEEDDADSAEIGGAADEIEAVKLEEPSPVSPVATETVDFALEEISLDDFNLDESDDATAAALGASINSAATAEDGLAMFGKPKLVDYDLAITEDDVTQAAPNVEETESPKGQEQNTNTTTVDNSLLEQIVSDLAGLKNEITSIKADLANLKEGKIAIPSVKNEDNNSPEIDAPTSEIESSIPEIDAPDSTPNIPDMPDAIAEDGEATSPFFDEAPTEKPVETQEGFFSDDDDEIVALSGNELDNIVNTSEITEEDVEAKTAENEISLESENTSELEADAGLPEEPSSENQDVFFSDDDEEIALSGNELDNIVNSSEITEEDSAPEEEVLESPTSEEIVAPNAQESIEETVETEVEPIEEAEETPSVIEDEDDFSAKFSEASPFGNISDDDMALESTDAPDTGLYMDINNDALEEPNLDEIEQNVEDSEDISLPKSEELPTEIEDEDKIIPPDESAMISDEAAVDEPTFDEPVAENAVIEEPIVDETASEDTVIEEPIADEPTIEEPAMDEAAINDPTFDEPVAEDAVIEEPMVGETASEDTAIEYPVADEPPIEEPAMDEATIDEPAFDEPVAEDTAIEEPIVDETASEDTAIEYPVADEPPIEEPAMDEAAINEPSFDEPVAEDTAIEEPIADEVPIEEPAMDEAAIDEPAFDEPVTEDTAIEEPIVDETASEDTVIEEPVADEPTIEEPAMDETATDEPAFDEPVAEDTAIEEPIVDETASEDTVIEEPVVQETQNSIDYEGAKQIQDGYINDITSEDDSISETLSNENMDYLSEDKDILSAEIGTTENSQAESSATDLPQNLKSEVKSVLLYMDQLLENLPEEKIVEFAKSDHFATYKKLFTELGLA